MKTGKLLIVGMGSSPDLVTVRGARAIAGADLCVVGRQGDLEAWGEYIDGKPVIFTPHMARVFYGTSTSSLPDDSQRTVADENEALRRDFVEKLRNEIEAGKTVAYLQWGDPMLYGNLWPLEMLPPGTPVEIVPGVGAFQSASAALGRCTVYGWDTNSVIITTEDWPGRADPNEKLMQAGTSMVFFNMRSSYPSLFEQLAAAYPADTPVAVVSHAGDAEKQAVVRSTVERFLEEVDWQGLSPNRHLLFVGKFLETGQFRKDGVFYGRGSKF
ncbi:MAG: SAM-dependent methyltransferase [Myxococcota bacterium]